MSYKGKVVIVTGSSSGIGAGIALKLAEEGAKLVITGRNEAKLKETAEKIQKKGAEQLTVVADLTKDDEVAKLVEDTIKRFGKIDVLINNAGFGIPSSILQDNALELYDKIIATDLRAPILLTNLAAPYLVESKGNIVNISSVAAVTCTIPSYFAYCTAKAGLDHFTRNTALQLAPKGVRVNAVSPGPVKTDGFINTGISKEDSDKIWDSFKARMPLKRIGEPEDIAEVVAFLASDKARSVTGSVYVADCGGVVGNGGHEF